MAPNVSSGSGSIRKEACLCSLSSSWRPAPAPMPPMPIGVAVAGGLAPTTPPAGAAARLWFCMGIGVPALDAALPLWLDEATVSEVWAGSVASVAFAPLRLPVDRVLAVLRPA